MRNPCPSSWVGSRGCLRRWLHRESGAAAFIAAQGTPGKGALGDPIIDAAKAVVLDHDFFAFAPASAGRLTCNRFSLLLFESDAFHRLDVDDVESDLV